MTRLDDGERVHITSASTFCTVQFCQGQSIGVDHMTGIEVRVVRVVRVVRSLTCCSYLLNKNIQGSEGGEDIKQLYEEKLNRVAPLMTDLCG